MSQFSEHKEIAISQTDSVLGAGVAGNYLKRLICTVTGAGSAVSIKDGAGAAIPIVPTGLAAGVHVVDVGARCAGAGWSVTTGANVTVVAVGRFISQP